MSKNQNKGFKDYSYYYDLLYHDKNYSDEAEYVVAVLTELGVTEGSILELGSGTGRHGRLIGESGYDVHGVELSKEMVDLAEHSDRFRCEQGDIRALNLGRCYDAVLALFHVVSYQTSGSDIKRLFEGVVKHLNPGGLFLFDFWYTPGVYTLKPETRVKRAQNNKFKIIRVAEPVQHHNTNTVDVNYQLIARHLDTGLVKEISETHTLRHFSLPEIDQLASQYGLTRILTEEIVSRRKPGSTSWAVCVGLRLE